MSAADVSKGDGLEEERKATLKRSAESETEEDGGKQERPSKRANIETNGKDLKSKEETKATTDGLSEGKSSTESSDKNSTITESVSKDDKTDSVEKAADEPTQKQEEEKAEKKDGDKKKETETTTNLFGAAASKWVSTSTTSSSNLFAKAASKVDFSGNFSFGQKPTGFSKTNSWSTSSGFGSANTPTLSSFGSSTPSFDSTSSFGGFKAEGNSASTLFGGLAKKENHFGSKGAESTTGTESNAASTSTKSTVPKLFDNMQPLFASGEHLKSGDEKEAKKINKVFASKEAPKSGEEEEKKVFTVEYCKLFRLEKKMVKNSDGKEEEKTSWQECGHGKLTVNDSITDTSRSRLIMRQDTTKVLYLNAPVWSGMNCSIKAPKNLFFSAINYANIQDSGTTKPKPSVFIIRSVGPGSQKRETEIQELLKILDERVKKSKD